MQSALSSYLFQTNDFVTNQVKGLEYEGLLTRTDKPKDELTSNAICVGQKIACAASMKKNVSTIDSDAIIFDSDASGHMSYRTDLFHDMYETKGITIVRGDKREVTAHHRGTVNIRLSSDYILDEVTWILVLQSMLFVEELGINLVSASTLTKRASSW